MSERMLLLAVLVSDVIIVSQDIFFAIVQPSMPWVTPAVANHAKATFAVLVEVSYTTSRTAPT